MEYQLWTTVSRPAIKRQVLLTTGNDVRLGENARRFGVDAVFFFLFLGFALSHLLSGEHLVSDRCVWDRMGTG